ncbi:hypothetical protein LTR37_009999 [Vermiconidia calcicola]|uniref:Uncharacterized protein n=1 Tax=Vermiconidia calcicola TaxID=1690605 RepID=A0ACC3N7N6_9PEZI|nr:hypothetical protein LTR37_009999 [Vermiconidia calcicola]
MAIWPFKKRQPSGVKGDAKQPLTEKAQPIEHRPTKASNDPLPGQSRMPVTIFPASHSANLVRINKNSTGPANNSREILRNACPEDEGDCLELLQSSFDANTEPAMLPRINGLVNAAITAYNQHHHLEIRPEDIWTAIIIQFNFYVNAHAEELRDKFVAHEGKKELSLEYPGTRYSFDFSIFAEQMGQLIQENVIDPELREWLMPNFSTTTRHDIVVNSIIMMGTMQKYFEYFCCFTCGLPSVTLLGEKSDYELIEKKLEKLCSFGQETTDFCHLLQPILRRFVSSFENPASKDSIDFWGQHHNMSGSDTMSGWITAFCFWKVDGSRQARPMHRSLTGEEREIPGIHVIHLVPGFGEKSFSNEDCRLVIDGQVYPQLDLDNGITAGFCKVPVKIDDNGDEIDAEMIAGAVGITCTSSGKATADGGKGLDTMQALSGWWIYEKVGVK